MKLTWREHVNFSMTLAWNLIGGLEDQDFVLPRGKSLDIYVSRHFSNGLQLWLKAVTLSILIIVCPKTCVSAKFKINEI